MSTQDTTLPPPPGQERAAFEAFCFERGLMSASHGLMSVSSHCDTAWLAWQARAAIAAQAPQSLTDIDEEKQLKRLRANGAKAWAGVDAQALRDGDWPFAPQQAQQAQGVPVALQLGVEATKKGAMVCLIQPHADGSRTVIYSGEHPIGDTTTIVRLAAAPQAAPAAHTQAWNHTTAELAAIYGEMAAINETAAKDQSDVQRERLKALRSEAVAIGERRYALAAKRRAAAPQAEPQPPAPADALTTLGAALDWITDGVKLNGNTAHLVLRFARALAEKLSRAEVKYGYTDGWLQHDWMDECRAQLVEHIAKGDPRDVAAYCAFLWHHGQSAAVQAPAVEAEQALVALTAEQERLGMYDEAAPQQDPVAWQVWWGMGEMRLDSEHAEKAKADEVASRIRSCTEVRPVYAAPRHAGRADAQSVDKLNAERYRFLQANRWHIVCNGFIGGHRAAGPDDLNPFVDAAMLAARAEKGGT